MTGAAVVIINNTVGSDSVENKPSRRISWVVVLIATALICVASYLVARQITSSPGNSLSQAISLPCTPDQEIVALGDGVIFNDGVTLHALDGRGRQMWGYTGGAGARFEVYDGGVASWNGSRLTLLDSGSGASLFSGSLEKNILSAKLGTEYVAVQIGEEYSSTLVVLTRGGQQVDKIELPNQTVLDYGFFSSGNMLWVMTLDTEGTLPVSVITTYRPGRIQTGKISSTDQVIYRVLFQSGNIKAVGRNYLLTYDYTGERTGDAAPLVYGWYLMDAGAPSDEVLMVFAPQGEVDSNVAVSDVRLLMGSRDRIIRMPFPCFSIYVLGGKVYGFNHQYVMICGINDAEPAAYQLPVSADRVLGLTGSGAAIVVSGDSVYLVPLPK